MLRVTFARARLYTPYARLFHQSSLRYAASVFKMPAMSPTMTEGGIVSWKVKPGDTYNAGDVLLEVETDKANIDVEAADDGKLWEILENDGATGVPVGKAIAYIADVDDDLSTLEKPKVEEEEEKPKKPEEEKKQARPQEKEGSKDKSAAESSNSKDTKPSSSSKSSDSGILQKANPSQKLSPAVELLLNENNISHDDAIAKIQASGPNGRILKGDVLAYLGTIPIEAVVDLAKYIKSREHLDLSNIVVAKPSDEAKKQEEVSKSKSKSGDASAKAKPKPTNIFSIEFSAPLEEHIGKNDFKQAFESAVTSAIHDTYARKFPQYSTSPTASSIYDQYDVFEELVAAPVTKKRFEVYDVQYNFYGDSISKPISNRRVPPRTDFDDLVGIPNEATPVVEVGTPRASVSFKVKFDEKLSDSKEFVNYFEKALLEEAELYDIPANLLRVSN
ncbi:PDX1 [Candida margitis]|uniref:PDX1 n=1 Tax=Candida margitis TaxID=1775924 RepID=UPI0022263CD8|nr:PDX1 [Candida margitis]KAI5968335.1 PDX1 [Candida margitis]